MKELEFKAQLAHDGSVTKKISDFHNVKELYQRLAEAFTLPKNEVRVFVLKSRNLDPMLIHPDPLLHTQHPYHRHGPSSGRQTWLDRLYLRALEG